MLIVNLPTPEDRTAEYLLNGPCARNGNARAQVDSIALAAAFKRRSGANFRFGPSAMDRAASAADRTVAKQVDC